MRLEQQPMEQFIGEPEPTDMANMAFEYFLVLALTVHQLSGAKASDLLEAWQEQDRTTFKSLFARSIALVVDASKEASNAPEPTLRHAQRDPLARLIAASILIVGSSTTPAASAYAEAAFVSWLIRTDAKLVVAEVLPILSEAFSKTWMQHINQPALLSSPRISIPELQSAINHEPAGAEKMHLLLSAASAATGVRIPSETLEWLRQIRK